MKHKAFLWCLAWFFLVTTVGCSKRDTAQDAEPPADSAKTEEASTEANPSEKQQPDPISLKPVDQNTSEEDPQKPSSDAQSAPAGTPRANARSTAARAPFGDKAQLLALRPLDRRPPSDTELGPLADLLSVSRGDRDVLTTLRSFFAALSEEREYQRYLDPNRRDLLIRSLTHHRENGHVPERVRYGVVTPVQPGEARVNVRCYGDPGEAEGEVVARETAGAWYVSVVAVDLSMLDVPTEPPSEPFEPSVYRFDVWE